MDSSTLLFIESHGPLAQLLQETLRQKAGLKLISQVDSVRSALKLLLTTKVDVVIIDLNLPEMSGLAAIPLILRQAPSTKVILLLDQDDRRYYQAALQKGSSACVLKQSIATDLVPTIQRILAN